MDIGIVGLGVIGTAVHGGLASIGHSMASHDTKIDGSTIENVAHTALCFICAPTPPLENGECDTSIVESVVRELVEAGYPGEIVIKSTVTPGTTMALSEKYGRPLAFCPEFLRERYALEDFTDRHDVCAIGAQSDAQYQLIVEAHGDLPQHFVRMTPTEAELSKYFSNVLNALHITFANQFSDVCQALGADYSAIKAAMVKRSNVKDVYLDSSPTLRGFGGPCLPKDTKAFAALVDSLKLDLELFRTIVNENEKYPMTVPDGMRR